MLKNDCFTVIFLKELVLELTERPPYVNHSFCMAHRRWQHVEKTLYFYGRSTLYLQMITFAMRTYSV